jgi:hypothetical protein
MVRVVIVTRSATGSRVTAFVYINALATSEWLKMRAIIRNFEAPVLENHVMRVNITLACRAAQVQA